MFPMINRTARCFSFCFLFPWLLPTAFAAYNMITCQQDMWCYQNNQPYNGQLEPVCWGIDVLQSNYNERGLLQTINYARLFQSAYEADYSATFASGCGETPHHPLWELGGATEYAHFLSVSRRDCSVLPANDHDTCIDYCTPRGQSQNSYTPFNGCSPTDRKEKFEYEGMKINSYQPITGNRDIQFNAEAICGSFFPCTDAGHCGAVFRQSRFILGVGRALSTAAEPTPASYLLGTRTYEFIRGGITPTEATNLQFWQAYENTLLHRIPSGSHYDKCNLYRNCATVGTWQTILFQFTYAHYSEDYDANTAVVVIDGTSHAMAEKQRYADSGTGLSTYHWAVFETEMLYPSSCSKYHFEIQSGGVTYRLPEDSNLEYATTGNGCDVNHYTGGAENCPGESLTPPSRPDPAPPAVEDPCFSPNVSVHVKEKGAVTMPKLKVGDEVLTGSGKYETIYAIDHSHASKATEFVQIHYEGINNIADAKPLEMTAKHMVLVDRSPVPVPAASVQVGDNLRTLHGLRLVTKIDRIIDYGIYNPLTVGGTIVINDGVIASTYSAFIGIKEESKNQGWIDISGFSIMSQQNFFDMVLKPYRAICTGISLDLCQVTTNEKVAYSEFGAKAFHFWSTLNNAALQYSTLLVFIALFALLSFFFFSPYGIVICTIFLMKYLDHNIPLTEKAKNL